MSADSRGSRGAIEVVVRSEGSDPVTVSLGLVSSNDLDPRGALRQDVQARPLSVVTHSSGDLRLRMLLPETGPDADIRGFAVSLAGNKTSRAAIVSASIEKSETGWQKTSSFFWAGFTAEGGRIDAASPRAASVRLVPDSLLSINLGPAGGKS